MLGILPKTTKLECQYIVTVIGDPTDYGEAMNMPTWYLATDSRLGGMTKAVWLLVQEHKIVSVEQIAEELDCCSTVDSEEALEELRAVGLVTRIEMPALQERFLLMDWLRAQGEIGDECVDEDGEFLHPPEQCPDEWRNCEEWERDLRAAGVSGERAYHLIMWAAKGRWGGSFLESWDDGPAMNRRIAAWVEWGRSVQEFGGS